MKIRIFWKGLHTLKELIVLSSKSLPGQGPFWMRRIDKSWHCATSKVHLLLYVFPSLPHCGSQLKGQPCWHFVFSGRRKFARNKEIEEESYLLYNTEFHIFKSFLDLFPGHFEGWDHGFGESW